MSLKTSIRRTLRPIAEPLASAWFKRNLSFSAAGEDRVILAWLEVVFQKDIRDIRYCDIGANHPNILSNTFLFYKNGASGVLVEPDRDLCAALSARRPRDTVLNVGVAFDERRSAKLRRMTSRVFNTFSPEAADRVASSSEGWRSDQRQRIVDEIDVALVPANEILAEHFADGIDFLSIDAEGVDLQILQSIDLNCFRPKMRAGRGNLDRAISGISA
jgi:FkbM family methyltransferase